MCGTPVFGLARPSKTQGVPLPRRPSTQREQFLQESLTLIPDIRRLGEIDWQTPRRQCGPDLNRQLRFYIGIQRNLPALALSEFGFYFWTEKKVNQFLGAFRIGTVFHHGDRVRDEQRA